MRYTKPRVKTFALLVFLLSTPLAAESYTGGPNNNPFENTTPYKKYDVKQSDSQFFGNTNSIQDDSAGNAANGKEYKLQDANRQAATGAGAATAAGTALFAAGMRELSLLNFPEANRLFALGSTEFAQAAASAATANQNANNRTTLLQDAGQKGSQSAYNPAEVANNLLTPEAREALAAQGINPEDFVNRMTNGQMRTPASVADVTQKGYVPEVVDYTNQPVADDMSWLVPETPGEDLGDKGRELLGTDDSAKPGEGVGGSSGSSIAMGGTVAQPQAGTTGPLGAPAVPASATHTVAGKGAKATEPGASAGRGLASIPNFTFGSKEADEAVSRMEMLRIGVGKAGKGGQNIFGVAKRNYRGFSKWRATRVARH